MDINTEDMDKIYSWFFYLSICGVGVLPSKLPGFYTDLFSWDDDNTDIRIQAAKYLKCTLYTPLPKQTNLRNCVFSRSCLILLLRILSTFFYDISYILILVSVISKEYHYDIGDSENLN